MRRKTTLKTLKCRKSRAGGPTVDGEKLVLTDQEAAGKAAGITVAEIADEHLAHVKAKQGEYKDQKNSLRMVRDIERALGDRSAASLTLRRGSLSQARLSRRR